MFLEIIFPKYQWTTTVDIEASYKSMPEESYDQYDEAYNSMQKHDWNCEQDAEEESSASEGKMETVGKPTGKETVGKSIGKTPDTQNV